MQDRFSGLTLEEKLRLEALLKKATAKTRPYDLERLSVPELQRLVELHKKMAGEPVRKQMRW
jgi:hypothetical protein